MPEWDACADPSLLPSVGNKSLAVWAGLDLGLRHAHQRRVGECLAQSVPSAAGWLHGALGLAEKRTDLKFDYTLGFDWSHTDWQGQVRQHLFRGAPFLNEVVFFRPATRTVIFTDLIFNRLGSRPPRHVCSIG
jgi:hypothetical protein